jgi:hypothetical protein
MLMIKSSSVVDGYHFPNHFLYPMKRAAPATKTNGARFQREPPFYYPSIFYPSISLSDSGFLSPFYDF